MHTHVSTDGVHEDSVHLDLFADIVYLIGNDEECCQQAALWFERIDRQSVVVIRSNALHTSNNTSTGDLLDLGDGGFHVMIVHGNVRAKRLDQVIGSWRASSNDLVSDDFGKLHSE